ncbi:MAG: DUF2330 domain-containing protein [Gemmataceae bacterium]
MKFLKWSLIGLALSAGPILACAVAPQHNKAVEIADESAIIIWNPATKTQHFIRRASFKSDSPDFGFLVPTPTKPELAEASDEAFSHLAKVTAPRIVTQKKPEESPGCGCSSAAKQFAAVGNAVQVLEEKRVAGFDAAVLAADDAATLGKWLKDHDYEFSPALEQWVKPYLAKGWKITAFKIAKSGDLPTVATSAVRMTFTTDQPYFPYREPHGQAAPAGAIGRRLLRVYFVGDHKEKGTLGESKKWPGEVAWANRLSPDAAAELVKHAKLPAGALPESPWLTEFEDHSSPRPGTDDVYFAAAADERSVERPPHVQYVSRPLPSAAMCCVLAAYLFVPQLGRLFRGKRK